MIGKSSVSSVTTISRAKLRTVKMTFVIVLAYIICWAPFFTVQMWSVWDKNFQWADSENTAVTLSALLASLNSCCNPWIYMIFSGHLLQDFVHCFSCCLRINTDFKKEDSDSSLRRTTLLTKMTNRSPTGSSGNWGELDNSPKTSIQADRKAPRNTDAFTSGYFSLLCHQTPFPARVFTEMKQQPGGKSSFCVKCRDVCRITTRTPDEHEGHFLTRPRKSLVLFLLKTERFRTSPANPSTYNPAKLWDDHPRSSVKESLPLNQLSTATGEDLTLTYLLNLFVLTLCRY
ncbi:[Arg8]-vasotocin receptor [Larimichthys crocea]|uniref:Uncharacterized protein n=1 Tax=Larimichthys crocea TaxID=215358 RepID=A0ACD3QG66_LARCR|nr:[Arg8]-vasotocin receptor [Larimichthys crocea]